VRGRKSGKRRWAPFFHGGQGRAALSPVFRGEGKKKGGSGRSKESGSALRGGLRSSIWPTSFTATDSKPRGIRRK